LCFVRLNAVNLAPVVVVAGSYFPAWILSLLLGVLAGVLVYGLLLRLGLNHAIPLPGLFYLLVGLLAAMLVWLNGFSWAAG
jgi:hypothetical protein